MPLFMRDYFGEIDTIIYTGNYCPHATDTTFISIKPNGTLYVPKGCDTTQWFLPTEYEVTTRPDEYGDYGYETYTRYNLKYYDWKIVEY